jgi:phosphoserine aminotransferase
MKMSETRPAVRPARPFFSSGPCAKRPGWTLGNLSSATLGRSHRSACGKAKLRNVIERTRNLLEIPTDWRLAIVAASDTGAVEMALWTLLGARPVDVFVWENFGEEWATDTLGQLGLNDARLFRADYGCLPDLRAANPAHDCVFVWNGTTSGVRVPDADWIADDRDGLVICDATSAAFAMDLPWPKLDVLTFSWQKVLGGEAAHGMLALSPRAIARLESHTPPWPVPKIFRLTRDGKLIEGVFEGETINTPSMLAVEDYLDTLGWAESVGGLPAMIARCERNFEVLARWQRDCGWAEFLAQDARARSTTSVCFRIVDPWFAALPVDTQTRVAKRLVELLEKEGVAFDIGSYRTAPPGLRIWCGATIEKRDLEALTPWLDWAWFQAKNF